ADIAIDGGKISALGDSKTMPEAARRIDATGLHVMPGIVDPHAHLGYMDTLEAAETETRAAACGGVTCLGVYILALKDGVLKPFEELKNRYESIGFVDSFWHLMVIDAITTEEIEKCPEQIGLTSFKFNMGYKGPHADMLGITATDDGATFRGFRMIHELGAPAIAACHTENIDIHLMLRDELIAQGRKDFGVWNDSRPPFVEAECMHRAIYLAHQAGCPLYIPHITIAEGVDILAQASRDGINVIGETCPQYLTHNGEEPAQVLLDHPACGCVNPPLRDKQCNERLWEGIENGLIQCVGSDLAPTTLEMKGDDIWNAPMGLGNTSELILPVMLSEGVNKGRIGLEKVTEVCSYNPAQVFGVGHRKGSIEIGLDADIVIVDLNKKKTVSPDTLHSMCDWTIYDGWELTGWPTHTILRGQVIVEHGEPRPKAVDQGNYIPRPWH
ncbi:MAG: amidohydrolase family protein, partial [Gammaproteobacteria bacterium]|nr:amidohydrolase family protein [Gammaproteobacteria bacterium]